MTDRPNTTSVSYLQGEELAAFRENYEARRKRRDTPERRERLQRMRRVLDWVDFIDKLLEEKGMSQKELAERMGVTESTVSRILSGLHNVTVESIAKIELALGEDIMLTPDTAIKNERVRQAFLCESQTISYVCASPSYVDVRASLASVAQQVSSVNDRLTSRQEPMPSDDMKSQKEFELAA